MLLVDGDIVVYRAACGRDVETLEDAYDLCDDLMESIILDNTFDGFGPYKVFLTGKGNYRHDYADDYKAHRPQEKPEFWSGVRDYLASDNGYGAVVSDGEEADDLLGIYATQLGPDTVIASVDKDLLQIPCQHYNITKGSFTVVDEFTGLYNFYTQILTGDRADNIKGLWQVGPKKAEKMLEGATTEVELYNRVLDAYEGDVEAVTKNGILLWIRRKEGEIWQPPDAR